MTGYSVTTEQRITLEVENYEPTSGFSYDLTAIREFNWAIRYLENGSKTIRLRFTASRVSLLPVCNVIEPRKSSYQITPSWNIIDRNRHGKLLYESQFDLPDYPKNAVVQINAKVEDEGPSTKPEITSLFSLILLLNYFGMDPDWGEQEAEHIEYVLPKDTSVSASKPTYKPMTAVDKRARVAFDLDRTKTSAHVVISIPSFVYLFLAYFVTPTVFGSLVILFKIGWLAPQNSFIVGAPATLLALLGQVYSVRNGREMLYIAVGSWFVPFVAAARSLDLALWLSLLPVSIDTVGMWLYFHDEKQARQGMDEFYEKQARQGMDEFYKKWKQLVVKPE